MVDVQSKLQALLETISEGADTEPGVEVRDRRGDRRCCRRGSAPGRPAVRPGWRRPPGTGATGSARRRRGRRRCRTASGPSRGRWPWPSGRRSWTRCTAPGSLTWPRTRSGRPCWTRAPTSDRSPPTTGCCARPAKAASAAPGHPPRRGQARAGRHGAEPGLLLGHHQAARPGEVDLLPPLRDPRHLQPLRRRLDGRDPRVRRPGREAHRRRPARSRASPAASSACTPTAAPR